MAPIIANGDYVVINKMSEAKKFVSFWNPTKNIFDFGYVIAKEREWVKTNNFTMTQFQIPNGHFWVDQINDQYEKADYTISHGFILGNIVCKLNLSSFSIFSQIDPYNTINTM